MMWINDIHKHHFCLDISINAYDIFCTSRSTAIAKHPIIFLSLPGGKSISMSQNVPIAHPRMQYDRDYKTYAQGMWLQIKNRIEGKIIGKP